MWSGLYEGQKSGHTRWLQLCHHHSGVPTGAPGVVTPSSRHIATSERTRGGDGPCARRFASSLAGWSPSMAMT